MTNLFQFSSSFFSSVDHLLLLGCTGLFGQHLLPRLHTLLKSGHNLPLITLVTRNRNNTLARFPYLSSINLVEADFLSSSVLALPCPPSHILHMANMSAADTFNGSSQYSKYRLLVNSVDALRSVVKSGTTKKIIFTSSGVAYGSTDTYLEDDNSSMNIFDSSYSLGFAKLNAEYLLSMLSQEVGFSLTVCRCFSFVSPFLPYDLHYALGNFVYNAVQQKDIIIRGDGSDLRSYQHVDDTIDWLLFLLQSDISLPLLNLGSDSSISIKDLALHIQDLIAPHIAVSVLNQNADPHNFRRRSYVPSILNAKNIGLSNQRSLNTSIVELASYIKSHTLL